MAETIYIVVPVYNRKAFTRSFLECLARQTFRQFVTIVVDDGSSDGTGEMIKRDFTDVRLLRGDGNLWWTGAINMGLEHALALASDGDAVLIINDDLEIDPGYLETLHGVSAANPRTLIGSVVVDIERPDLIADGGWTVNWWTAKFRKVNENRSLSEFPPGYASDVSMLTGWGTLVPVEVFRRIGLYDSKHFQQCGDTELTVRAKNAGYRLIVSYQAIVKLHVNASDTVNVSGCYSVKDLKRYFFGIKSNCRLKYRWFFNVNTARNPLALSSFLIFDLLRISVHFFSRVRWSSRQEWISASREET